MENKKIINTIIVDLIVKASRLDFVFNYILDMVSIQKELNYSKDSESKLNKVQEHIISALTLLTDFVNEIKPESGSGTAEPAGTGEKK